MFLIIASRKNFKNIVLIFFLEFLVKNTNLKHDLKNLWIFFPKVIFNSLHFYFLIRKLID
jgi:hypothetical protein